MKKVILITGAAGRVGRYLTKHLEQQYELRLTDIVVPEDPMSGAFIQADLADLEAIRHACQGVDTVVHLGANPSTHATWKELLQPNIVGIYNLFEAASEAGCRRVIFASSVNAVAGYSKEFEIRHDALPRPSNLYGATKVWGETIGRLYADQQELSTICLRLGWIVAHDSDHLVPSSKFLEIALTYRDMARLFSRCIAAPDDLKFGIFNGLSNNQRNWLDISQTREVLGYDPLDDASVLAEINARSDEVR